MLVFLSVFVSAFAEPNADKQAKQGAELMYNFELGKAEQIFLQVKKNYSSEPIGYYYHAQIYLWLYMGNSSAADLERFLQLSDEAIEKVKEYNTSDSRKEYANLLLGNLYTQRVLALGKASRFVDMAWAGKKANSYLSDVIEANPENADAYLGLGLFKFALSQIPSTFRYVLSLIGFDGNLKDGIHYLKSAAAKSALTKVEAQFYFAQISADFLTDYATASRMLGQLQKQYPGNVLFTYTLAIVHMKNHRLADARTLLLQCLQNKVVQFKQLKAFTLFLLGDTAFMMNDFKGAEQWYKRFLAEAPEKSYTGIAALRLAYAQEALGNRNAASSSLERADDGNTSVDEDVFAAKRAKWFKKFKMNAEDLMLMRYSHLIDQGRYSEAVDSLLILKKQAEGKISQAEVLYQLGTAYLYAGKLKEASQYLQTASATPEYHQKWITAFSLLYAAKAEFLLGSNRHGKELLLKAADISDFDFAGKYKMASTAVKYNFNQF